MIETFFQRNNLGADIAVIRIEENADRFFASGLSSQIRDLLDEDKPPNLVVDLGPVADIDYKALDLLAETSRLLADRDRVLVLITDHPTVRRILKMRGFDHVFPVDEPLPRLVESGR